MTTPTTNPTAPGAGRPDHPRSTMSTAVTQHVLPTLSDLAIVACERLLERVDHLPVKVVVPHGVWPTTSGARYRLHWYTRITPTADAVLVEGCGRYETLRGHERIGQPLSISYPGDGHVTGETWLGELGTAVKAKTTEVAGARMSYEAQS